LISRQLASGSGDLELNDCVLAGLDDPGEHLEQFAQPKVIFEKCANPREVLRAAAG
jgi:hypothetical protein